MLNDCATPITRALETRESLRLASYSRGRRGDVWKLVLPNNNGRRATVRMSGSWLLLTAPLNGLNHGFTHGDRDCFTGLRPFMSGLAPPLKLSMDSRRNLVLKAELPLGTDTDMLQRLHETLEALETALPGETRFDGRTPEPYLRISPATCRHELEAAATGSGWPCANRSGGRFAVSLEVAPFACRAVAEVTPENYIRVSTKLALGPDASSLAVAAATKLALNANYAVRMVRFTLEEDGLSAALRASVDFVSPPGVSEFRHACGALSVACLHCAAETKTLLDERVSTAYLAT